MFNNEIFLSRKTSHLIRVLDVSSGCHGWHRVRIPLFLALMVLSICGNLQYSTDYPTTRLKRQQMLGPCTFPISTTRINQQYTLTVTFFPVPTPYLTRINRFQRENEKKKVWAIYIFLIMDADLPFFQSSGNKSRTFAKKSTLNFFGRGWSSNRCLQPRFRQNII